MRRVLVLAVLVAATAGPVTGASAVCWPEVNDICVSPCDLGNLAYRTATGSDLTSC